MLIIYFAGFATAIYALAPVPEANADSAFAERSTYSHDAGSGSEEFALAFNSRMRKFIGFAEEKAARFGEFINAKLAQRQEGGGD